MSTVPYVASEEARRLQPIAPKLLKQQKNEPFQLDGMAPIRAARERSGSLPGDDGDREVSSVSVGPPGGSAGDDGSDRWEPLVESGLDPVEEEDERAESSVKDGRSYLAQAVHSQIHGTRAQSFKSGIQVMSA